MHLLAVLTGFGVGAIAGMTAVGGGSLTTSLLMSVFGLAPAVAMGTDLWFAAITKSACSFDHKHSSSPTHVHLH